MPIRRKMPDGRANLGGASLLEVISDKAACGLFSRKRALSPGGLPIGDLRIREKVNSLWSMRNSLVNLSERSPNDSIIIIEVKLTIR